MFYNVNDHHSIYIYIYICVCVYYVCVCVFMYYVERITMYMIKQRIRAHLFVNFALYKYFLIIIIIINVLCHSVSLSRGVLM